MARLSERDRAEVAELSEWLATMRPGAPPPLGELVRELRRLLRADRGLAFGVHASTRPYALQFACGSGFPRHTALERTVADGVARARGPWALFDPQSPELSQRNRVVCLPPPARLGRDTSLLARIGVPPSERARRLARMQWLNERFLPQIGLADMAMCRAIVCDDDGMLLAWVGVGRPEPFGERERLLLAQLVAPLRRRLRTERLVRSAALFAAVLPRVLDQIERAVFVVDARGVPVHVNERARQLVDDDDGDLQARLRAGAAEGGNNDAMFDWTAIGDVGVPAHFLVVARSDGRAARTAAVSIADVATRWAAPGRERAVLERVLVGEANKEIAARLGCSLRTVELYVSRLLARAGVGSRAALAARLLGVSDDAGSEG